MGGVWVVYGWCMVVYGCVWVGCGLGMVVVWVVYGGVWVGYGYGMGMVWVVRGWCVDVVWVWYG